MESQSGWYKFRGFAMNSTTRAGRKKQLSPPLNDAERRYAMLIPERDY